MYVPPKTGYLVKQTADMWLMICYHSENIEGYILCKFMFFICLFVLPFAYLFPLETLQT